VSEAIAVLESHELEAIRPIEVVRHRAARAFLEGDLAAADALQKQVLDLVASDPPRRADYGWRYRSVLTHVAILLEEGKEEPARVEARDFLARNGSWTQSNTRSAGANESPWLERIAVGQRGSSRDEFERSRTVWVDDQLNRSSAYPGLVWPYAYGEPAMTQEEAENALRVLPKFEPLASSARDDVPDAHVGHAYLLAGSAEKALPYLRRAAAHCGAWLWPWKHMHAVLELGLALEATGEKTGACKAYGEVLDRWGAAKPRSVTAERARDRVKALRCSD
jgi:serine/threonine-protein kinase